MTLHDISVLVRPGTPEWPGDTPWTCRWTWEMAQGASVNVSAVDASPHVGTHADAPLHVTPGGAGVHALPLAAFTGPARVVDVRGHPGPIELEALGYEPLRDGARLLLRTGRSIAAGTFPDAWPALSPACARALVTRGMVLLGVDAPSVDARESKALEVHHALFGGGACVLENLDLSGVEPGPYELSAFPLRWEGLDAAPVRAVLRERTR
jgi:arylformamidase